MSKFIPYILSSSKALLSSSLSCRFFHLDERTISGVDLLEMMWKGGIVALCPYHGHLPGFRRLKITCVLAKFMDLLEMTLKGGIITLSLPWSPSRLLEDRQQCMYSPQTFLSDGALPSIHSYSLTIVHILLSLCFAPVLKNIFLRLCRYAL